MIRLTLCHKRSYIAKKVLIFTVRSLILLDIMGKKVKSSKKRTSKASRKKKVVTNNKEKNGGNGNGNGKLTSAKRKLFVEEYLKDFNATRAYRAVHGDKQKDESAWTGAYDTLRNTEVMFEIDRRLTDIFAKLEVSNELLIAGYVNEAFMDNRSFFIDGAFVGMNNLNMAQQACIESLETDELFAGRGDDRIQIGVRTKIKFYSRKAARDVLMKYKGLIKDVTNNNTIIVDNKTEVTIAVAKELKEELGDSGVTKLNKLLSGTGDN